MKATKLNVRKLIQNEIVKLDGYDTVSKTHTVFLQDDPDFHFFEETLYQYSPQAWG